MNDIRKPRLATPKPTTNPAPVTPVTAGPSRHIDVSGNDTDTTKVKVRLHKRVHWWLKSLSRKQKLLVFIIFLLLAGGGAYFLLGLNKPGAFNDAIHSIVPTKAKEPEPTTVASRMTGRQVEPALNKLPTTAVMIENSPDARPQAGLRQADVVYEAIAEGGITRFLALYQESQPASIGPVRSVRPYYVDFFQPYDAAIAHAGGSAAGLQLIRSRGLKDLDHGANGSTYERVKDRFAPHNLFTSRAKLLDTQKSKGFKTSTYTGLARKEKATPAETPTATTVDLTISSVLYNVHYDYDAESNRYLRSEGGKAHKDAPSGKQLSPDVVVALVMTHRYEGIYSVYGTTGKGTAYIFQDGTVHRGSWKKKSGGDQLVILNNDGEVMPLNPGQTWFTLVSSTGAVKYKP